ncbi:MAG: thioredoxin domain-containing protein [bacterium]|nr:thioredoxin domain-containing protein [bacterium]
MTTWLLRAVAVAAVVWIVATRIVREPAPPPPAPAIAAVPAPPPRTRHLLPDGRPRHTNRLARESSPYLQQHAHNPVDWYPWGPEAFARAAAENKPILLSIGYSTCHWCHVMAEESFDDEGVAAFLNAHYVAVKVDREERPDVDAIYMAAVMSMGESGGWPLTVWLTPDRRPFYGGGYYPPATQGRRPGFLQVLQRLEAAWREQPGTIDAAAADVVQRLTTQLAPAAGDVAPDPEMLRRAVAVLQGRFDAAHGGFDRRPKFPRPLLLDVLLRWHRRTADPEALAMVTRSLEAMAAGGLHDQVGGGFHRYAPDAGWRVPHFEKMLVDNALLARLYLDAAEVTGRDDFAATGRDVLDWMLREMADPAGGFHAAIDADSDGGEGRAYTWTAGEVTAAVGPDLAPLALAYFGVGAAGAEVDGRSVLHVVAPLAAVAAQLGLAPGDAAARREAVRDRLRAARDTRPRPHVDRKVIAGWNALAVSALVRGAQVLRDPRYMVAATRTGALLAERLRVGDRLARSALGGVASGRAVLEDQAAAAGAFLDLAELTGDPRWLARAVAHQEELDARFADAERGGWFRTPADGEALLVREKPDWDGAEPSGSALALRNAQRLHLLTSEPRWQASAARALRAFGPALRENPDHLAAMLAAVDFALDAPKEIVVVAPPGGDPAPLAEVAQRAFVPNRALVVTREGDDLAAVAALVPWVAGKTARDGVATAYVCERQVCRQPTNDPAELAAELARAAPLPEG